MKEIKLFFSQEKVELKEFENYQTFDFNLDIPRIYGFNLFKELDKQIKEQMIGLKVGKTPTIFRLRGDFEFLRRNLEKRDLDDFFISIANIFISYNITKENRDREPRLTAPKILQNTKFSDLAKRDFVNKKLLFPNFRVEIVDLGNNEIFGVM